jgi:signal transduction histidine kinase
MAFTPSTLTLLIKDFGRGLPQVKKPEQRGLGFIAMRERAELVGGNLEIHSDPGEGTTLKLVIPLDRTKPAVKTGEQDKLTESITGSQR